MRDRKIINFRSKRNSSRRYNIRFSKYLSTRWITFFHHYFQKNSFQWMEIEKRQKSLIERQRQFVFRNFLLCLSLFLSLFQTPSFLYFCGSLIRYLHICRYLKRLSCADLGYGTCAAFPVSGDHKKKERKKGRKEKKIDESVIHPVCTS